MEKSQKSKKTISSIVGVIVGVTVAILLKQFVFGPPSFDKALAQAASTINETCPFMVDHDTRLDNVLALPNNTLQYNYTLVNWVKDSIDVKGFEEYMQPLMASNIQTNPDMKLYRENKTTMAYNYKDKDGVYVTKITIAPDQYLEKK